MSDKVYLGSALSDLNIGEKTARISRVNLLVDSQTMYTAGNNSGRTIEKSVPWASQGMANDLLAALRGIDYQPFSGTDALIDPSAEIGDGITVGGIYSVLAQKNINYGKMSTSSIAAPCSDEIDDEYPYISKTERLSNRKLAQTYSYIIKTSNEIKLSVANDIENIRSEIDIQLDKITSTVQDAQGNISQLQQTANSLQSEINAANGNISSIEQYAHSISISVSNGSTSSTIKLMAGSTEIDSENITFSGFVTFTGLSGGTTTINGACIKTGTIDAQYLNLSGAITWNSLSNGVQNDINGAVSGANKAILAANTASSLVNQLANGSYTGGTFIDGKKIYSPTIYANKFSIYSTGGGDFYLYDGDTRVFDIEYSDVGMVSFNGATGGSFTFNTRTTFAKEVYFNGNVSGISSLSLTSVAETQGISTLAIQAKASNPVTLSDDGGILKIELSETTWYLDASGLHQ